MIFLTTTTILLLILLNSAFPIALSLTLLKANSRSSGNVVLLVPQQPVDKGVSNLRSPSELGPTTELLGQTTPPSSLGSNGNGNGNSNSNSNSEPFIKKMRFQVPESARLGNTMKLSCVYELSGASLHAMKLFKDDKEFYRYTPAIQQLNPSSEEQRIAFASPGLKVDLVRSNDQDIWIKILDKRAAGTYKCQVSIEDTFKSISAEKRMDVIEKSRTMPSATTGTAATSWLGSPPSSSLSSSSSHQQQRHTVQQQSSDRNRAQASFMQQQQQQHQHQQSTSSGVLSCINSNDSHKISIFASIVCTIIIIIIMNSSQERKHQRQLLQQGKNNHHYDKSKSGEEEEEDTKLKRTRMKTNKISSKRCWRLLFLLRMWQFQLQQR